MKAFGSEYTKRYQHSYSYCMQVPKCHHLETEGSFSRTSDISMLQTAQSPFSNPSIPFSDPSMRASPPVWELWQNRYPTPPAGKHDCHFAISRLCRSIGCLHSVCRHIYAPSLRCPGQSLISYLRQSGNTPDTSHLPQVYS